MAMADSNEFIQNKINEIKLLLDSRSFSQEFNDRMEARIEMYEAQLEINNTFK